MVTKNSGFTLLEVLVATVILFTSIAAITMIFRSSYVASEKAQKRIEQTGVTTALLKEVQLSLRELSQSNENELLGSDTIWGMPYEWRATLVDFKAPPDKFDNDSGLNDRYDKRYKLWQVSLTLGKGKSAIDYQYHELSWLN